MWLRFWASAVSLFGLGSTEAWLLTPHEYWALYDFKVQQSEVENKPNNGKPLTRAEFEELRRELGDGGN